LGERYELQAVIGRGGMGEVYLAHDRKLANQVAIKRLTPQFASSPELRQSLQREAQIMARLSDAHIVRLFDLAEFYGDSYLILEYVAGPTLREMIRSGYRASAGELALIMSEITQGLTVAHDAGIIHRDLKPSNLLLALKGPELAAFLANRQLPATVANAKIKITDFGIAKAIAEASLTVTNAFSGTPGYMAPEQFRGEVPGPQTDVYALGVIAYEVLTGSLPAQPVQLIPGVHPAVTQVVEKSLSPAMHDRFPTAAAFYEALYRAIEGRSPFQPVAPAPPAMAARAVAIVVLIVLGIAAIAITIAVSSPESRSTSTLATVPTPVVAPVTPLPNFKPPPPFNWLPFPRAAEVPAIVEEARGKLTAAATRGPQNPKLKWDVELPETLSIEIAMVGKDGTVYLTGAQGELVAVRDGKLQWAFKSGELVASLQELAMDKDGLVWFKIHTMGGYERYAFNRDGKGGRLPRSFENAGPSSDSSRNDYSCWKNRHTLSGPQGDLDIDDNCLAVAVGPGTRIYVATDAPQILAVSKQGHVEFKYDAPCQTSSLIPVLPKQLVFACRDQTVHALRDASEIWKRAADGKLAFTNADSAGTFYYGDGTQDSLNQNAKGHVHAIDAQGKDLWSVELPHSADGSVAFGAGGQMYIFQRSSGFFNSAHLISLSD
jgi:serine/threonine protein kinase/outer membrane protein assembly factor BamB